MTQKNNKIQNLTNQELSIQISLNGLSFCILNSAIHTITTIHRSVFDKKLTPYELLDRLKHLFNTEDLLASSFDKVNVIHVNELSTLVPKPLFQEEAIADYLKLNAKILKTDLVTFDHLEINDCVNVYVPYVNINNYLYDKFGSFNYKHYSTVLIEQLLKFEKHAKGPKLYVHVAKHHFEIVSIENGSLLLYNSFEYNTAEDFIYYILFTIEQLELNPEHVPLVLLGAVTEGDHLYNMAYTYIRNLSFGSRFDTYKFSEATTSLYSDFTLLKSI